MASSDPKKRGISRRAAKAGSRGSPKSSKKTAQGDAEPRSATLGISSPAGTERAWRVAQLAATLATRYVVHPGQSNTGATNDGDWTLVRDEATPELDRFYLSLLRRAEFLLAHGEARVGWIHAAQLFDPTRCYGIREITDEFRLAGWTGLTSENSIRALLKEIGKKIDQRLQEQIEHLLRFTLDPTYLPHHQDKKLAKGERSIIEREIAELIAQPDLIKTHQQISAPIKEQIGLERFRQYMIRHSLGGDRGESGINPYAAFGACADDNVFKEKLWRKRADLSRLYAL